MVGISLEDVPRQLHEASHLIHTIFSKWGTDEKGLFKFLCSAPPEHLKKLNLIYADKYGYTLLKVMEKELGGDAGRAGLFMLGMKLKPYETIAKLIEKACKGKIHKFVYAVRLWFA